jgi:hypothetical protein
MLERLGDHPVWAHEAEPSEEGFTETLQTTWRELLDDGLIDDEASVLRHPRFRLTTYGWIRALTLSGAIDLPEMRERCTRLARSLKAIVKGRESHYDEFVSIDEIASDSGLPAGWVFNAIKGRLLGVVFPDDRWDAQIDPKSSRYVRVSPTFGLNHLFDN